MLRFLLLVGAFFVASDGQHCKIQIIFPVGWRNVTFCFAKMCHTEGESLAVAAARHAADFCAKLPFDTMLAYEHHDNTFFNHFVINNEVTCYHGGVPTIVLDLDGGTDGSNEEYLCGGGCAEALCRRVLSMAFMQRASQLIADVREIDNINGTRKKIKETVLAARYPGHGAPPLSLPRQELPDEL